MSEEKSRTGRGTDTLEPGPADQRQEIRRPDEESKQCCRDLGELNNEFDAFLYAVSHDLGAPIRAIQGFSLILNDHYSDKLDAKGKDYLLRIQNAGRKIDRMVNDLLQISRLGKAPMNIEELDLCGIFREIADRLVKSAPERRVSFVLAGNIRACGDRVLISQVLENLLDNAWKFTGKKEKAVIEFGALRDGLQPIFFIKDNGIGFAMDYAANRLFKPFQKLHHASEYPGSGIGLAKVSRIIRRSGGKIWAESAAGKGTTIFFTLGRPG